MPVLAAVTVAAVIGGVAVAAMVGTAGEGDDDSIPPRASGAASPSESEPVQESDDSGPEDVATEGRATGDLTVTLTQGGRTETRSGALRFVLDCTSGTTCTTKGWSATGDLSAASGSFFRNYLGLEWQGGDGTWSAEGGTPANCDDVAPEDLRAFVTGTLVVDGGNVEVVTKFDEYDFGGDKQACFGPGIVFNFVGRLS